MTAPAMDLHVEIAGQVAVVEMRRPPHNYFDAAFMGLLADRFEALDGDDACRAIVLCAQGRSFCAGFNVGGADGPPPRVAKGAINPIYEQALRLFSVGKPVVAALQGAVIGGGLGLALAADMRVATADCRLEANFTRLGLHPGFGLTETLPALIGPHRAWTMLCGARPLQGATACDWGLVDRLAAPESLVADAIGLAADLAGLAPLAVRRTGDTLRMGTVERIRRAMIVETENQRILAGTRDFAEGVAALKARRPPHFTGA